MVVECEVGLQVVVCCGKQKSIVCSVVRAELLMCLYLCLQCICRSGDEEGGIRPLGSIIAERWEGSGQSKMLRAGVHVAV